jgi:hypothetical protein
VSFTGGSVTLPSGPDLFRFYQASLVNMDTEFHETVTRPINVVAPNTELLVPVLAILCLYFCVLCVALAWSWLLELPSEESIPKNKVEWMMQVVNEVAGRDVSAEFLPGHLGSASSSLESSGMRGVPSPFGRVCKGIQMTGGPESGLGVLEGRL